jgi:hypothetical protein
LRHLHDVMTKTSYQHTTIRPPEPHHHTSTPSSLHRYTTITTPLTLNPQTIRYHNASHEKKGCDGSEEGLEVNCSKCVLF